MEDRVAVKDEGNIERWSSIPGIRVTVYLPPYLVGLKISDWTLAKAEKTLVG